MLNRVDFPEPLVPTIPKIFPCCRSKVMPCNMNVLWSYVCHRFRTLMTGTLDSSCFGSYLTSIWTGIINELVDSSSNTSVIWSRSVNYSNFLFLSLTSLRIFLSSFLLALSFFIYFEMKYLIITMTAVQKTPKGI
jgi:hypothetical protein